MINDVIDKVTQQSLTILNTMFLFLERERESHCPNPRIWLEFSYLKGKKKKYLMSTSISLTCRTPQCVSQCVQSCRKGGCHFSFLVIQFLLDKNFQLKKTKNKRKGLVMSSKHQCTISPKTSAKMSYQLPCQHIVQAQCYISITM